MLAKTNQLCSASRTPELMFAHKLLLVYARTQFRIWVAISRGGWLTLMQVYVLPTITAGWVRVDMHDSQKPVNLLLKFRDDKTFDNLKSWNMFILGRCLTCWFSCTRTWSAKPCFVVSVDCIVLSNKRKYHNGEQTTNAHCIRKTQQKYYATWHRGQKSGEWQHDILKKYASCWRVEYVVQCYYTFLCTES